jgi:hypothetical protein
MTKKKQPTATERLLKVFPNSLPETFDGVLLLDCVLGKPELYDKAIIGVGERCGQHVVLIYDLDKLMDIDAKLPGGEDYDTYGAVTGAWMGGETPIILTMKKGLTR